MAGQRMWPRTRPKGQKSMWPTLSAMARFTGIRSTYRLSLLIMCASVPLLLYGKLYSCGTSSFEAQNTPTKIVLQDEREVIVNANQATTPQLRTATILPKQQHQQAEQQQQQEPTTEQQQQQQQVTPTSQHEQQPTAKQQQQTTTPQQQQSTKQQQQQLTTKKPLHEPQNAVDNEKEKEQHPQKQQLQQQSQKPLTTLEPHGINIDYPGYRKGEWVFTENTNRPLGRCCTNEPTYFPKTHWNVSECKSEPMLPGDWRMPQGITHWCHCKSNDPDTGLPYVPKVQGEWIWTPTLPEKRKPLWDAKLFCKLLHGRNMYFLGDSTTRQTKTAVQSLLQMGKADCTNQLKLWRSDMLCPFELDNVWDPERDEPASFYLDPLFSPTSQEEAIVIVSMGPHVNHDGDYNKSMQWFGEYVSNHTDVIENYIENPQAPNKQTLKKGRVQLYWKTNNPAHDSCKENPTLPTKNSEIPDGAFNKASKYAHHNNVITRDRWSAEQLYPLLTGIVDMTPLYLRPDGHTVDCFHYCWSQYTGSPIEYFGVAMLDALLHPDKRIF